jgi:asparagine synthase (glutamine-hydrolysing)
MCGIFSLLGIKPGRIDRALICDAFNNGASRGPEYSYIKTTVLNILGFHRLAINGLDSSSNQPFDILGIKLVCNGEIYNYKALYETMNMNKTDTDPEKITPKTNSDCEVIIHLYLRYGIEQTLRMLDGVFAFVLIDTNSFEYPVYIARDLYGVRPLYELKLLLSNSSASFNETIFGFASELKCLQPIHSKLSEQCLSTLRTPRQFEPGTYTKIVMTDNITEGMRKVVSNRRFSMYGNSSFVTSPREQLLCSIRTAFEKAVFKRVINTDRPVACLLSGGLDSSLVTSIVNKHYSRTERPLETYTIGLPNSEDAKYAAEVAKYLGTKHTNIVLTEDGFFDAIPEVIRAIESYDTTTVRASVGNYLVAKYIAENSDAKVIFNGDGSDEVMGGYLYFHCSPDPIAFDNECRRLLKDIHMYDVQRSDRTISSNGLEPRTPFLDRDFVQTYLAISPQERWCGSNNTPVIEKQLLRDAFSGQGVLPETVLWRSKEAFSDGVSSLTRPWYEIIDEKITKKFGDKFDDCNASSETAGLTREQRYYRCLFDKYYLGCSEVIPYYWMPKFVDATDASARTLSVYPQPCA